MSHRKPRRTIPRNSCLTLMRVLPLALVLQCAAASPQPQTKPAPAASSARVRLQPRFAPGDVLRYEVRFQTVSDTKRTGSISDAQGPSQTAVTWDAVLRVEVLPALAPAATPGAIRLRTTYEKSDATLASDTPDPQRENIEKQYTQLEGHSMEFTLGSDGHVSNVQGLEGVVSSEEAVKAAEQWLAQFSAGAAGPAAGVALDQEWSSDEAASALPLAGYVWRSDSTYLRNEPCPPANPPSASAAAGQSCAVILTSITLVPPRSQKDATPPEYSRNSLHTSGMWSGSGQSLSYISLQNGWLVGVKQNMSERMDVTITSTIDSSMRYSGTVATDSTLSLLPRSAPSASPVR
jgi:hypothetical protein